MKAGETFGFGGQCGKVVQMAYVVEDIHAAMDWWLQESGTGPWFLLDHFLMEGQVYRGQPSCADVTIAMSFAGGMNIELIQPLDRNPSVYRDSVLRRGYGHHHIGVATDDIARDVAAYQARGYVTAFTSPVPTGGSVAYMERGGGATDFVELISATTGMDAMFTSYWHAAQSWDGSDPIRTFGA